MQYCHLYGLVIIRHDMYSPADHNTTTCSVQRLEEPLLLLLTLPLRSMRISSQLTAHSSSLASFAFACFAFARIFWVPGFDRTTSSPRSLRPRLTMLVRIS